MIRYESFLLPFEILCTIPGQQLDGRAYLNTPTPLFEKACSNPKFIELENLIPELVVPSMNSSALSFVLERVMTDASFRESAVAKISKYADETSWEKVARLHVKAYKKALQETLPGYHDIEGIRLRNTSRRL